MGDDADDEPRFALSPSQDDPPWNDGTGGARKRTVEGPPGGNGRRRAWIGVVMAALVVIAVVMVNRPDDGTEDLPPNQMFAATPTSGPGDSSGAVVTTEPNDRCPAVCSLGWNADTGTDPAGCGASAPFPVLDTEPVDQRIGQWIHLDGSGPIDLDQGIDPAPAGNADEWITAAAGGTGERYLVLESCSGADRRLVRVGDDGTSWTLQNPPAGFRLLAGSTGAVAANGVLTLLQGRTQTTLPQGFVPIQVEGNVLIGEQAYATQRGGPPRLVLRRADNGALLVDLGLSSSWAAGSGQLIWSEQTCMSNVACTLHRYRFADHRQTKTELVLPVELNLYGAVIAPDGGRLARVDLPVPVEGAAPDAGAAPNPAGGAEPLPGIGPVQIQGAVQLIDLATGDVQVVPGITDLSSALNRPGLLFSDDGRWLILAVEQAATTPVLAWRPGLARSLMIGALDGGNAKYAPVLQTAAPVTSR